MTDTDYKIGGEITAKLRIKSIGSEGGLIFELGERDIILPKGDHIVGYEPPYIPDDLIAFDGTKWPECDPNDEVECFYESGFRGTLEPWQLFNVSIYADLLHPHKGKLVGYRVVKKAEADNNG